MDLRPAQSFLFQSDCFVTGVYQKPKQNKAQHTCAE